jgi:F-type H+-transporting ATPase subunit delta
MSTEVVARRYARAVFELAKEQKKVSEVVGEFRAFADAYAASSDFQAIAVTPNIAEADRQAIIDQIGKRLGASATTSRTVSMLAARQRLSVLPDLVRLLDQLADDHNGVVRASVRAAQPLSEAYLSKLQAKMEEATGKKVTLTFEEDPSLIAGIVTQIGDRFVDGSIRGKLNRFAESLRQT